MLAKVKRPDAREIFFKYDALGRRIEKQFGNDSPEEGMYISQDPIRLAGNNPTLYGYVKDVNSWIDIFGLAADSNVVFSPEILHPKTVTPDNPTGIYTVEASGYYGTDKASLYGKAKLKESFDGNQWVAHHISYDPVTNTMQMQLVEVTAHSKTDHVGGVKEYESHNDTKYKKGKAPKSC
jgi:uncharacterized protein RhaS with RHS repeats